MESVSTVTVFVGKDTAAMPAKSLVSTAPLSVLMAIGALSVSFNVLDWVHVAVTAFAAKVRLAQDAVHVLLVITL